MFSRWLSIITRTLISERQRRGVCERERVHGSTLALKVNLESPEPRRVGSSIAFTYSAHWKRQGNKFSPRASRGDTADT